MIKDTLTKIKRDVHALVRKLNLQEYVCDIVFKNITDENDAFNDIWSRIKKLAPKQSQWELLVPTQWIEMERRLQKLASQGRPVIKFEELLAMAPADIFKPTLFVKYMKTSGLVLTTNTGNLYPDDEIVIDPQWLIDAFKQVIDFNDHHESGYGDIREIGEGKLSMKHAQEVWKGEKFKHEINSLLRFMENLGLIAKPRAEKAFFYIPSLLDGLNKEEIRKWLNPKRMNVSKTLVLDYRIEGRLIPFPHFDKLMAEVISRQSKDSLMSDVKRNCCIGMMENETVGFVICHASSIIKITMFSKSNLSNKKMLSGEIGTKLRHMTLDISREIAARFNQHVQDTPLQGISCNPYPPLGDTTASYVTKDKFQNRTTEINCCKHADCNLVTVNDFQPWEGKHLKSVSNIFYSQKETLVIYIQTSIFVEKSACITLNKFYKYIDNPELKSFF